MFGFLLLYVCSTQNGMTPAELAQSRGYRDIAKLIIDEGMYFIIWDNNFMKTSFSLYSLYYCRTVLCNVLTSL